MDFPKLYLLVWAMGSRSMQRERFCPFLVAAQDHYYVLFLHRQEKYQKNRLKGRYEQISFIVV